jgi:predicted nucleic acid-binding protein
VRLVADANVLLSAVLGGGAARVLRHPRVEAVLAAAPVLEEVHEYAVSLARKKRLQVDTVLTAVVSLPVIVVDRSAYVGSIREAERRIAKRDPDDVETLALAIRLGIPVWSNDDDFKGTGVTWYTTARLLAALDAR